MPPQLSPNDVARVKAFLDQISPASERPLTVQESGHGGPGINVPLDRTTNPANFPRYEFREYPKMLTKTATQEDIDAWKVQHRIVDAQSGHISWASAAPRVGQPVPVLSAQADVTNGFAMSIGEPLIMQSKEQEEEYLGANPPPPKTVSVSIAQLAQADEDELARLKAENAKLRAQSAKPQGRPKRKYTKRAKPEVADDLPPPLT
jgi:hypothetical protein